MVFSDGSDILLWKCKYLTKCEYIAFVFVNTETLSNKTLHLLCIYHGRLTLLQFGDIPISATRHQVPIQLLTSATNHYNYSHTNIWSQGL